MSSIRIVDVWAEWCAPCKKFAPIFNALSEKYAGIIEFEKVNIEETPERLKEFNIRGIPAIVFEKDGVVHITHIGILSQGEMEAAISELLYGD